MGFFKEDVSPEKQRKALEAMCPECRAALIDSGKLMRPTEPFPEFNGMPTHVLIDGVVPYCKLYWKPEIVARRQQNKYGGTIQ